MAHCHDISIRVGPGVAGWPGDAPNDSRWRRSLDTPSVEPPDSRALGADPALFDGGRGRWKPTRVGPPAPAGAMIRPTA